MKKAKLILCLFLGVVFLNSCGKNSVPGEEQLKSDFMNEILNDEEMKISEFSIENEQKEENQYKAIINVVYDNQKVQHEEQYHFIYEKYDEWILNAIDDYEADNWSKKPLSKPSIDEFEDVCLNEVNQPYEEYDKFEIVDEKTKIDLENGSAIYVFAVESETVLRKVTGEISFNIKFDYEKGTWGLEEYSYEDSYVVEHNLIRSWSGKGSHSGEHGYEIEEKDFSLSVTEYNDDVASAILTYDGKQYYVSGVLNALGRGSGSTYYTFDMCNEGDKIRVDGSISYDGEMNAVVDTAYVPGAMFFYPRDRYGVIMLLKD